MAKIIQTVYELSAEDDASKVLEQLGVKGEKAGEKIDRGAKKASKGLDEARKNVVALNQAWELAQRMARVVEGAIGGLIKKSLEFRFSWDAGRVAIERLDARIQVLAARLGDTMIPLLTAVSRVFVPIINGIIEWTKANEDLIAVEIAEWAATAAKIIGGALTAAVLVIGTAWNGWKIIIGTVHAAVATFFAEVIRLSGLTIGILATLAKKAGVDSLAGAFGSVSSAIESAADEVALYGQVSFETARDGAQDALALYRGAMKVNDGWNKAWDNVVVQTKKAAKEIKHASDTATEGTENWIEKNKELLIQYTEIADRARAAWRAHKEKQDLDLDKKKQDEAKAAREIAKAGSDAYKEAIADFEGHSMLDVEGLFGGAGPERQIEAFKQLKGIALDAYQGIKQGIGEVIAGQKTAEEFFRDSFAAIGNFALDWIAEYLINLAMKPIAEKAAAAIGIAAAAEEAAAKQATTAANIKGAAAEAGAKAVAAHAGIPFVGLAIGLIAAAAIVAAVYGFASGSGTGGRDMGSQSARQGQAGKIVQQRNGPSGEPQRIQRFAGGGRVFGGTPGVDSVLALLRPGEEVRTNEDVRRDSGTTIIHQDNRTIATYGLPSKAAEDRWHRDNVMRVERRAAKRGRIKRS